VSKRWGFRGRIKLSTPSNYVFLQHLKYTNPRERPKTAQVWTLGMPLTGCLTLGKSLKPLLVSLLSSGKKPKKPHKKTEILISYLTEWLWRLYDLTHVKHWAHYLAHDQWYVSAILSTLVKTSQKPRICLCLLKSHV